MASGHVTCMHRSFHRLDDFALGRGKQDEGPSIIRGMERLKYMAMYRGLGH